MSGKDIEIYLPAPAVLGRKNLALLKELYIGKMIYFLPLEVEKRIDDIKKARNYILKVYKYLDSTKDQKMHANVEKYINGLDDETFVKKIKDKSLIFQFIVEPFTNISFEQIVKCADYMDIPLEEKVWIPEMNCWTKTKVPIGITYIQAMEQLGADYESVRSSTGKVSALTGQPGKGRKIMGGQSVSELDLRALLTFDTKNILKETLTLKSDDFVSKRKVVMDIIDTGEASMPPEVGQAGRTNQLFYVMMTGLGLYATKK